MTAEQQGFSELMELAGFALAHAVWCISDGETLIPMMMIEGDDGQESRQLNRFVADRLEDGVAQGLAMLEENPSGAARMVFVYDGSVTIEGDPNETRSDALLVEAVEREPAVKARVVLRYRPSSHEEGFAVFRPAIEFPKEQLTDSQSLGTAFFSGLEDHEKGTEVFDRFLIDPAAGAE